VWAVQNQFMGYVCHMSCHMDSFALNKTKTVLCGSRLVCVGANVEKG
jgi:hypothetical protein